MCAIFSFFFFNDTATTEIYTLSLHDALPIWRRAGADQVAVAVGLVDAPHRAQVHPPGRRRRRVDRLLAGVGPRSEEHTSELQHANISYAVFCLKKKKTEQSTNMNKQN